MFWGVELLLFDEDELDLYWCCFFFLDDVFWLGVVMGVIDFIVVLVVNGMVGVEFIILVFGIDDVCMRFLEIWGILWCKIFCLFMVGRFFEVEKNLVELLCRILFNGFIGDMELVVNENGIGFL